MPKGKDKSRHIPLTTDRMVFNALGYPIIALFALFCLFPFWLVISGSFTSQEEILRHGFSLWPRQFSLDGYRLSLQNPIAIVRSYGINILVTTVGTALSVFICTMTGYVLTRKDFLWRNFFSLFFFFTTLFSGGLAPFYILVVNTLGLKNSLLTYANQPEEYMNHNRLGDGKVYVVPQNYVNLSGFAITIREDIRKELGVPEVTDLATLEGYLTAVSENKPGIFPYAATIDNQPLKTVLFNSGNNIISLNGNPMEMLFSFKYTKGMTPQEAMDQVVFVGKMPEYREWAVRMKDWAGKGFWSRSAIADTVQVRDSFENGQSAMFVQNTGTLGVANMTLRGKNLEPMMIDIFPDAYRFLGLSNAGIAVPSVSKNLGRALMWLDKLKNDQRYYELYRFGIEGEHWIDLGNRMWEPGPKQDRYVYGDGSWGFQSVLFERDRIGNDPQSLEIWRRWRAENEQPNPLVGFNFDIAPVQNEIAALTNVRAEHMYLIDLGLVDDVDAAIEAMNKAALAAGIDRVMEELKKQMADYVAHNQ